MTTRLHNCTIALALAVFLPAGGRAAPVPTAGDAKPAPSLEMVPAEYRAELEGLEDLGEDELWRIARSRPAAAEQRRLERLLVKNERGELTDPERRALDELRYDGDRRMLRRSYAALLLKYRGHRVPNLEELRG